MLLAGAGSLQAEAPQYHATLLPGYGAAGAVSAPFSGSYWTVGTGGQNIGATSWVYGLSDTGGAAVTTRIGSYISYYSGAYTEGALPNDVAGNGAPGVWGSLAWGINDAGDGVGYSINSSTRNREAHVYDHATDTKTLLGTLGGTQSVAYSINESGQIVGWATTSGGGQQAFVYENGVMTSLHLNELASFDTSSAFSINDHGLVVGVVQNTNGATSGFVLDLATGHANSLNVLDDSGVRATSATAINNAGTAIGWYHTSGESLNNRGAVLWVGANTGSATVVDLHTVLQNDSAFSQLSSSSANAINEAGQVVGKAWRGTNYSDPYTGLETYANKAFLYDDGEVYSLTSLLHPRSSLVITEANSINNEGQIGATAYFQNGGYSGYSGVVLSEIRSWQGSEGGAWDDAANWVGAEKPDAHTAAYVTLDSGEVLTGPEADTTIYALSLDSNPVDRGRLVVQENTTFTVLGDTLLYYSAIDATAEGSRFETGVLRGAGSVAGEVQAGWTWVDAYRSLNVSGTLVSTHGVLVSASSTLNASGAVLGAVTSFYGGNVNAQGDLTIGDAARADGIELYNLNVGENDVTLLDANAARVWALSVVGGNVNAANGLEVQSLAGHGTVDANVTLRGTISADAEESLAISGNVAGAGFVLGDVTLGDGKRFLSSGSATLSRNVAFADGTGRLLGKVLVNGNVSLDNVTLLGSDPDDLGRDANGLILNGRHLSGSGDWDIQELSIRNQGTLTATGDLAIGRAGVGSVSLTNNSTLNVGEHEVVFRSQILDVALITMEGGVVRTSGVDLFTYGLTGYGEVDGGTRFANRYNPYIHLTEAGILQRANVVLTGDLTVGSFDTVYGFALEGDLNVGAHTLTLRDEDEAEFHHFSRTTLAGGTIEATNGLIFFGDDASASAPSNPLLLATGEAAQSNIVGDVTLRNAVIHATSGNSLAIDGDLSGYGVVVGNVTWGDTFLDETEGAAVVLTRMLGIEDATARFLSNEESAISNTELNMAGGTVLAENGLALVNEATLSGYGNVELGAGNDFRVENSILKADTDEEILIKTNVVGGGLVVGNVKADDGYTFFETPTVDVELTRTVNIGEQEAAFYSASAAKVSGSHRLLTDQFGRVLEYSSTGELGIEGGRLASANGIEVVNTRLFGHGEVVGNLAVKNSIVDVTHGDAMVVDGNISGYGVVFGNLGVADAPTQTNTLATAASGVVDFASSQQLLAVGARTANVFSQGEAIFGTVTSEGGEIVTPTGGITLEAYEGYGKITGGLRMENSLLDIDVDHVLEITGELTGYGIVVGNVNKTIAAPTGSVYYNGGIQTNGRTLTVYSATPAYIGSGNFSGGTMVLPSGAIFGALRGVGAVQLGAGNTVYISSLLAPGSSPGTIEIIGGNLTLESTAITEIEYFGVSMGQYDFLDVEGTLTLGGQLKVVFGGGYTPTVGQILPGFFDAAEVLGGFSSVTWAGLAPGMGVAFNSQTHELFIVEMAVVPEPSTWALGILGAGAFAWLRRRRAA